MDYDELNDCDTSSPTTANPMMVAPQVQGMTGASDGTGFDPQGKYVIRKQGPFSVVEVVVKPGDPFHSEAGAMITMANEVDLGVTMKPGGGALKSMARCICAKESLFINRYTVEGLPSGRGADVLIGPPLPGEIALLHLDGAQAWRLGAGAYLASDEGVQVGVACQSLAKTCCSGESCVVLKAEGSGRLLINGFGSVVKYDLAPGELRVFDNDTLLAWTDEAQYNIGLAVPGECMQSCCYTGEGCVNRFEGPATVYIRTRSIAKFANGIAAKLPNQARGGPPGTGADAGGGE
mmetsp:Transcript_8010/g.26630  ORF Transcript_8010/g.26630 Transcript_8010/m.26630 type:complete len:292 (-) Transcript_8010:82-957(-)